VCARDEASDVSFVRKELFRAELDRGQAAHDQGEFAGRLLGERLGVKGLILKRDLH